MGIRDFGMYPYGYHSERDSESVFIGHDQCAGDYCIYSRLDAFL